MDNICKIELFATQNGLFVYKVTVSIFDVAPTLIPYQDTNEAASALQNLKSTTSFHQRDVVYTNISHRDIRNFLFDLTGFSQQTNLNSLYTLYNNGIANPYVSFSYVAP